MVFEEAKQNGKFSYPEAFCFILPRLVSKKQAKVTKQNVWARRVPSTLCSRMAGASPAGVAKGTEVLTAARQTLRQAMGAPGHPTCASAGRAGAQATRRLSAGSDTCI